MGTGMEPEVINCNSAEEFLQKISDTSDARAPTFCRPWVYRGHANANWSLFPPAWRDHGRLILAPLAEWLRPQVLQVIDPHMANRGAHKPGYLDKLRSYALETVTEVFAVSQFCTLGDELGLMLPNA